MSAAVALDTPPGPLHFLGAKEVTHRVGLSLSTVTRYVADGSFPGPRKVGPRRSVWVEGEVVAWQMEVMAGRAPAPGTYRRDHANDNGPEGDGEGT